ncbi:MAG: homocysteine S-methyltransferase family protein [Phycisphaerae bacterium]|nr:homocysteine S-methyltransferase family protein [Phycisphaerae bacterium]
MMGATPERAAAELDAAGADLIGANCGAGIEAMVRVAEQLHSGTSKPIWIKPNAGLPELLDRRTVFRQTPERMAKYLPSLVVAGTRVVGGCCGTTPSHIRALVGKAALIRRA